jgi:NADPH:quinone reductase-like Zn-dependent oxidoreductase
VPKPRILGADGAGVIAGTDERVVINPGIVENGRVHIVGETRDGTHAELIAVPAAYVHPIPDGLGFEEAAAFPLVFETAYRMLVPRARLQAGEWVLVWGIGGGVATASLALAKALGAHVVVTSSSDEKLARARALGASDGINYRAQPDWQHPVRELTGGRGADYVVEVGGAGTLSRSIEAARIGGQVGLIGVLTGGQIDPAPIMRRNVTLRGIFVGSREMFEAMNRAIAQHRIEPVIDKTFAFEQAAEAYRHLESAAHVGKVVISAG